MGKFFETIFGKRKCQWKRDADALFAEYKRYEANRSDMSYLRGGFSGTYPEFFKQLGIEDEAELREIAEHKMEMGRAFKRGMFESAHTLGFLNRLFGTHILATLDGSLEAIEAVVLIEAIGRDIAKDRVSYTPLNLVV